MHAEWFCYPSGHYNATVVAAVRAAGFRGSTTVVPGWASPSEDPYRLPRLRVLAGTSPQELLAQIEGIRGDAPPRPVLPRVTRTAALAGALALAVAAVLLALPGHVGAARAPAAVLIDGAATGPAVAVAAQPVGLSVEYGCSPSSSAPVAARPARSWPRCEAWLADASDRRGLPG